MSKYVLLTLVGRWAHNIIYNDVVYLTTPTPRTADSALIFLRIKLSFKNRGRC